MAGPIPHNNQAQVFVHHGPKLPGCFAQLPDLLRRLKVSNPQVFEKIDDAAALITPVGSGVVIFCISEKEEIPELLSFLQKVKPMIRDGMLLPLVFNSVLHERLNVALKQSGVREILSFSFNSQAFLDKLRDALDSIHFMYQRFGRNKKVSSGRLTAEQVNKAFEKLKEKEREEPSENFEIIAPMNYAADCWRFKLDEPPKQIGEKWMIYLIGPTPTQVSWKRVEDSERPTWEMTLRNPNYLKVVGFKKGKWLFEGNRPELESAPSFWRFVGDSPHLYFRPEDTAEGLLFSRFRGSENGKLEACDNSPFSKENLGLLKKKPSEPAQVSSGALPGAAPADLQIQQLKQPATEALEPIGGIQGFHRTGSFAFDLFSLRVLLKNKEGGVVASEIVGFEGKTILLSVENQTFKKGESVFVQLEGHGELIDTVLDFPTEILEVTRGEEVLQFIEVKVPVEFQRKALEMRLALEKRQLQALKFVKEARGLA